MNRRPSSLIKTHLAVALAVITTAFSFGLPATAAAQSTADTEKIRAKVQTLSASKDSQVQVRFRDKTKLKGYIDSVEPVTFTLEIQKTERNSRSLIPRSRVLVRPATASLRRPG
jgi:hypothetical protein